MKNNNKGTTTVEGDFVTVPYPITFLDGITVTFDIKRPRQVEKTDGSAAEAVADGQPSPNGKPKDPMATVVENMLAREAGKTVVPTSEVSSPQDGAIGTDGIGNTIKTFLNNPSSDAERAREDVISQMVRGWQLQKEAGRIEPTPWERDLAARIQEACETADDDMGMTEEEEIELISQIGAGVIPTSDGS